MSAALKNTCIASSGTTGTIPSHAIGDLLVGFIYDGSANTAPSKPSASGTVPAWVDILTDTGANTNCSRTVKFVATATNHTSGTWTNATHMIWCVITGQAASGSEIGSGKSTSGSAINATPITSQSLSLDITTGSSLALYFCGYRTASSWTGVSSGFTSQASNAGIPGGVILATKDSSTTGGTCNFSETRSGNGGYRTQCIEILAASAQTKTVGIVTNSNTVRALTKTKVIHKTVGVVTNLNTVVLQTHSGPIHKTLGVVTNLNSARPLSITHAIHKTVGIVTASNTVITLSITTGPASSGLDNALDNFNRSDQQLSTSPNWTDNGNSSRPYIVSNQLTSGGSSGYTYDVWTATSFSLPMCASITAVEYDTGLSQEAFGIVVGKQSIDGGPAYDQDYTGVGILWISPWDGSGLAYYKIGYGGNNGGVPGLDGYIDGNTPIAFGYKWGVSVEESPDDSSYIRITGWVDSGSGWAEIAHLDETKTTLDAIFPTSTGGETHPGYHGGYAAPIINDINTILDDFCGGSFAAPSDDIVKTIGHASETDSVQSLNKTKIIHKTLGLVTNSNSAITLVKTKVIHKTVGIVSTTNAARPQTFSKAIHKTAGIVTNLNTAIALFKTQVHRRTVGIISETDSARSVTHTKDRTLGVVTNANTVRSLVFTKTIHKALGVVSESDSARTLTKIKPIHKTAGIVAETDSARSLSYVKVIHKTVGVVTSANSVRPASHNKHRTVGIVSETDSARTLTKTKTIHKTLGVVNETDLVRTAQIAGGRYSINAVVGLNTARPLTFTKAIHKTVGIVTNVNTARPQTFTKAIHKTVTRATETDSARPQTSTKGVHKTLGIVTNINTVRPLTVTKPIHKIITRVLETDLARTLSIYHPHLKTITFVSESNAARALSYKKPLRVTISRVVEADVIIPINFLKRVHTNKIIELDRAIHVTRLLIILSPRLHKVTGKLHVANGIITDTTITRSPQTSGIVTNPNGPIGVLDYD